MSNGDGEFGVDGEGDMTPEQLEALNAETIEPVGKNKKATPHYPWNPKSWQIVKPKPKAPEG